MQHKKIILVDDEVTIAEELSELLDTFDYPCVVCDSVDAALAAIADDPDITMVLTDMRMPGKDGSELIKELASMQDRQFEYMVISGHLDVAEEIDAITGSKIKLLRKPINVEELMNYLEERDFGI